MTVHTLKNDGAPYNADGTLIPEMPVKGKPSTAGTGSAACACGWLSDPLGSRRARISAQRIHKMFNKNDPEPEEAPMTETVETPEAPETAEAPKKAKSKSKPKEEKTPASLMQRGRPRVNALPEPETSARETAVQYDTGNRAFRKPILDGSVAYAEAAGFEARVDTASDSVIISGGDARGRKALASTIKKLWGDGYVEFSEWKKSRRDYRKGLDKEGWKVEHADEKKFWSDYLADATSDGLL